MEDVGDELAHQPAPGTVISGKYRVERVLGAGGMAIVFAARDLRLDRLVALKILRPATSQDPALQRRFTHEARALARIQNQHVARILDVDALPDGNQLLVLEYLEGEDLGKLLDRKGPLEASRAVDFVLQACEAVHEAHALGIVHRDLKPANLLLARQKDGSDSVKVLDFGISKSLDPHEGDGSVTTNSDVFGSPRYMSPEQLRSSRDVTGRTDVWSLAVILYELVSGRVPFTGASRAEVIGAILHAQPKDLVEVSPRVPPGLWQAIERALNKDASLRTGSIVAFAGEIAAFGGANALESLNRMRRVAELLALTQDGGATFPPGQNASENLASAGSSSIAEPPNDRAYEAGVSTAWVPERATRTADVPARRNKLALAVLATLLTVGALVYSAAYPRSELPVLPAPVAVGAPSVPQQVQASSAVSPRVSEISQKKEPLGAEQSPPEARAKAPPASRGSRSPRGGSARSAASSPPAPALAPETPPADPVQPATDCPDPYCDRK